jgi:hypothetical protein
MYKMSRAPSDGVVGKDWAERGENCYGPVRGPECGGRGW